MVMAGGAVATACREIAKRAATIGGRLLQTDPAQVLIHDGKAVGPHGSVTLGGDRARLVPAAAGSPGRRRSGRARSHHRVQAGARQRNLQLRHARRAGRGRSGDRRRGDPRLRHRRGRRQAGQSDDRRWTDLRRLRARRRHGAVRGDAVRSLGQPLASTLSDYLLPGPTEVPAPTLDHMETLAPYTEFGVKGIGEGGAIAPPAAIANAVNDALRPLGAELLGVADHAATHPAGDRASGAEREARSVRVRMSGGYCRGDCAGGTQRPGGEIHRRRPVARPHAQPSPGTARSAGRSDRHRRVEAGRGNGRRAVDRRLRHPRRYRGWPGPGSLPAGCCEASRAGSPIARCATAARSAAASPTPILRPTGSRAWRRSAPASSCAVASGRRSVPVEEFMLGVFETAPAAGRAGRSRFGAAAVGRGAVGLLQGVPQDRRVRPRDRRRAVRSRHARSAGRSSAPTESRPVVFADARELFGGRPEAGLSASFDQQPARAGACRRRNDRSDRAADPPRRSAPRHRAGQRMKAITLTVNGKTAGGGGRAAHASRRLPARDAGPDRHASRLRARHLRRLHAAGRRRPGALLHHLCSRLRRRRRHHHRGPRRRRDRQGAAPGILARARAAVRLLHARNADLRPRPGAAGRSRGRAGNSRRDERQSLPLHRLCRDRPRHFERDRKPAGARASRPMPDAGRRRSVRRARVMRTPRTMPMSAGCERREPRRRLASQRCGASADRARSTISHPQATFAHSFVVHHPREEVWAFFARIEDVAACLPGASVTGGDDRTSPARCASRSVRSRRSSTASPSSTAIPRPIPARSAAAAATPAAARRRAGRSLSLVPADDPAIDPRGHRRRLRVDRRARAVRPIRPGAGHRQAASPRPSRRISRRGSPHRGEPRRAGCRAQCRRAGAFRLGGTGQSWFRKLVGR